MNQPPRIIPSTPAGGTPPGGAEPATVPVSPTLPPPKIVPPLPEAQTAPVPTIYAPPVPETTTQAVTDAPSADLLRHAAPNRLDPPPRNGWRAGLNQLTGGRLRTKPGRAERAERAAQDALRRPFAGPRTIMIANPKGGAGKTPTTLLLGATLGSVRGGYVLAWDNNETRGTLGLR